MNTETIKRIVDDERVERLTAQLCRHWDVATERLEELVQDLNEGMDTCAEAEIYAALMRMQSAILVPTCLRHISSALLRPFPTKTYAVLW